ncbi:MAG: PD-(D/E)XK nuclease family protein [Chloroflexi bacterium]|nr:PD-(D/E)XK nuclease family protein [Chloroflexota bacterium]
MRRRLAEIESFAGVRFETLPRIAELLGAGLLAADDRSPLARPIGDYVAEQVGRESRERLKDIGDLPGYARALRQIFRRLRRGGITTGREIVNTSGMFREILRLYSLFREQTSAFYDDEDLMDAATAAIRTGSSGALHDLGALYVAPPGPLTAAGIALLEVLRDVAPSCAEFEEPAGKPEVRFVLAPDPASEVREIVRDVVNALDAGCGIDEAAVFHGAADSYPGLLREVFESADIPTVPLPGLPLIESRTGRAALMLARLPGQEFARTAVMDFLSVAKLKTTVPTAGGGTPPRTPDWDRISREAGISKGSGQWTARLRALVRDRAASADRHESEGYEQRAIAARLDGDQAEALQAVVEQLARQLEPLSEPQSAASFIVAFKAAVDGYVDPSAEAFDEVHDEIEQLGTVGAIGGKFTLATFAEALDANLRVAHRRPASLGSGILLADHRMAAGLQFKHVALCGAFEGALPAGPGVDSLLDDSVWRSLKDRFPQIEDVNTRIERSDMMARRAIASAGNGSLTWSCPRFEPGGTREYYPSYLMVAAVQNETGDERVTASMLRRNEASSGQVRSVQSPMTGALRGAQVDLAEGLLRDAVRLRQSDRDVSAGHPRMRSVEMLRHRRSPAFTEWDGNVSALRDDSWLDLQRTVSPTSLENYAVCGYKYFCRSLLRLNVVEEPEEREMMDPATRGSLIHKVLDRFFRIQKGKDRPTVNEAWTKDDLQTLMRVLDDVLLEAEERGLTGLDIYAEHEARTIRADLAMFLQADTAFRRRTGAVPTAFEAPIPETDVAGIKLRGYVDRIDTTEDGRAAWIIDYKTGSSFSFDKITDEDPLVGGTKLQLPTYLTAVAGTERAQAIYWFITRKGAFKEIPYDPTPAKETRFNQTLDAIFQGIRSGVFPAVPSEENEFRGNFENCMFCEYDRICSRRRDHELAAKSDDPSIAPWSKVAGVASGETEE